MSVEAISSSLFELLLLFCAHFPAEMNVAFSLWAMQKAVSTTRLGLLCACLQGWLLMGTKLGELGFQEFPS